MYQREAMWLAFSTARKPIAVKVGVGGINAISGLTFDGTLHGGERQDYVVCPRQLWLDDFKSQSGHVTQFTAMPLGSGQTAEGQLTGGEMVGGIEVRVYKPKPGRFPDTPPSPEPGFAATNTAVVPMGLAPGGVIS